MDNKFDATPSLVGYIYQVRFALFLAWEKLHSPRDHDDCYISIEKLDDISFQNGGSPEELLQAKHISKPGNLTDRSSDLWKTLRVWSEQLSSGALSGKDMTFTLITTESCAAGSVASMLSDSDRSVSEALKKLREISLETSSETNQPAYAAFRNLTADKQQQLIDSVYVVSNSPNILETEEMLRGKASTQVKPAQIDAFVSRLEGRWFQRAIIALTKSDESEICIGELRDIIHELSDQFRPENLPDDFSGENPVDIDVEGDRRTFVEQLRLFDAPNSLIEIAIKNYYRAYQQRARWSREGLLMPGELQSYKNRLKERWEHKKAFLEMYPHDQTEDPAREFAREIYKYCQIEGGLIPIRSEFKSEYVAQGTYHDLSDRRIIGWHPDFERLLDAANEETAA